jgi:hypothetical protein
MEKSMVNDKELAAIIADKIFECGSIDTRTRCHRIEFKYKRDLGGGNLSEERGAGGFAEEPLARFIEGVLREHRSY